jgi:hypothetical protein
MTGNVPTRLIPIVSLFALCIALSSGAWAHCAGNHQGSHPHCSGGGTSGGDQDPVFELVSVDLGIAGPVPSHSLDPGDVIVFRGVTVDLSAFDTLSGCSHGYKTGTLSTRPKSNEDPDIAIVRFGFRSQLESGQEAHHILVMEGEFRSSGNWPPALGETAILENFYYWELAAEQKKAQRQDCAGDSISHGVGGPWVVEVTRTSDP